MATPDLLEAGIYTVQEAAFLLGVSQQRVRGWISGYARRSAGPIIENELGWSDDRVAVSFRNLMELRFIAVFEQEGVKFQRIRRVMEEVREITTHPHPFATNIVFKTDGRKIVGELINKATGKQIYDLESRNFEIADVVYRSLHNDVEYDFNGEARFWIPRRHIAPNVIVHPRFAFGKPIMKTSGIPTRALAQAVHSEGNAEIVADAFDRPVREVREAVRFERELRKAA
jgi:uncharacterized protein (DUF433 family)